MATIPIMIICLVISLNHSAPTHSPTDHNTSPATTAAPSEHDSDVMHNIKVDGTAILSKQKSDGMKGTETNISSVTKAPFYLYTDPSTTKTEHSKNGNRNALPHQHTLETQSHQVPPFQLKPSVQMTSKKEEDVQKTDTSLRQSTIRNFSTMSKMNKKFRTIEQNKLRNKQSEINVVTHLATIASNRNGLKGNSVTTIPFVQLPEEIKTDKDISIQPKGLNVDIVTIDDDVSTTQFVQSSKEIKSYKNTTIEPRGLKHDSATTDDIDHATTTQFVHLSGKTTSDNDTTTESELTSSINDLRKILPSMNTYISQNIVSPFTRHSTTGYLFTTSYRPWSTSSNTDDPCPPVTMTFTNVTAGQVTWAFNYSSCVLEYNWLFDIPEGYACAVEFHQVDMQYTDILHVIVLYDSTEWTKRKFTQLYNESLAPLLLREETLKIKKASLPSNKLYLSRNSNFNISFTVIPLSSVPDVMFTLNEIQTKRYITYLCTGISPLPSAITCDGIRHCEHGEDEEGCAYSETGCGDWFPYNNHCLKANFISDQYLPCAQSTYTSPLYAERLCQSEYNATLAVLPDITGIQIAANMIRKSGFLNAVVGIRKVKPISMKIKHLYRFLWQWGGRGGPIAYEQQNIHRSGTMKGCAVLTVSPNPSLQSVQCDRSVSPPHGFICMRPNPRRSVQIQKPNNASFHRASASPDQFPTKECPDGSVVQTFHRCQWGEHDADPSMGWSPSNLPLFQCRFGPPIHYALLCDGKYDCADGSDETVCQKPRYSFLLSSSFFCTSLQAIAFKQQCDGVPDCFDNSDEEYCVSCHGVIFCPGAGCVPYYYDKVIETCPKVDPHWTFQPTIYSTGMVKLDGYGLSILKFVTDKCPEGSYQCINGLCIPSFLMNNGEKDCFHGEDEDIPAHSMTCPGYYRCQGVGSCVHKDYVCDGIYHCPDKDDEMFCHMTCPQGCVCEGQAFTCSNMTDPVQHLHVRYLDLSHAVNVSLENIHAMEYLFSLNLSFCRLGNITLTDMLQLQTLDLSFNSLTELASLHLHKLSGLLFLDLSNNPLGRTVTSGFSTLLKTAELQNLRTLILINISLEVIADRVFSPLAKLQHLDLHNNPLHTYDQESLWGLEALEVLYTDQSKLCCNYFHPSLRQCYAPVDELSSCDDLLAQNFFRVFLWIVSFLAIAGNCGVFAYRLLTDKRESNPSSPILLKNLCASDFLMGVYMVIIGVADTQFQGNYVAMEAEWTRSVTCTIAGFLSFVSSEVSAFLVCVITVDRVLVICFPFHYQYHLGSRVTIFVCCTLWIIGITLAALPVLAGMEFYGLNGICLPLPITRKQYSGQTYAFHIFIVLNFVVFLFIGIGQALIYHAIHNARTASGNQQRRKDMTIARRLLIIVFTDFCCWFPVGVMGLLAFHGTPIPGQLNVWTAIFVLPLNSALNPFLYTLNGLLEEWKKRRMERRAQIMLGKLQTDIAKWQPSSVEQLIKVCIQSKKVDNDKVMRYLGVSVQPTSPSSLVQCTSCSEPDALGSSAHLNKVCSGSELNPGGTQTTDHYTASEQ